MEYDHPTNTLLISTFTQTDMKYSLVSLISLFFFLYMFSTYFSSHYTPCLCWCAIKLHTYIAHKHQKMPSVISREIMSSLKHRTRGVYIYIYTNMSIQSFYFLIKKISFNYITRVLSYTYTYGHFFFLIKFLQYQINIWILYKDFMGLI